jgi:hypothetical protein
MLLAWAYAVFHFLPFPMAVQGFRMLALFGWTIYTFQFIEPKGKILAPELPG